MPEEGIWRYTVYIMEVILCCSRTHVYLCVVRSLKFWRRKILTPLTISLFFAFISKNKKSSHTFTRFTNISLARKKKWERKERRGERLVYLGSFYLLKEQGAQMHLQLTFQSPSYLEAGMLIWHASDSRCFPDRFSIQTHWLHIYSVYYLFDTKNPPSNTTTLGTPWLTWVGSSELQNSATTSTLRHAPVWTCWFPPQATILIFTFSGSLLTIPNSLCVWGHG